MSQFGLRRRPRSSKAGQEREAGEQFPEHGEPRT